MKFKQLAVLLLIISLFFVSACVSNNVVEEKNNDKSTKGVEIVPKQNIELINSNANSIKEVSIYSINHWMDLEEIVLNKGDILKIDLATDKDLIVNLESIGDFKVVNESSSYIEFEATKSGEYALGCAFNCKQADLAKEIKIIVE
jgi:PBP1b-binding outer membrane lipoprotein LpoB